MAKKQKVIDISNKNSRLLLGKTLKSARKQKNLSIADLHELTKIPVASIESLEKEEWDNLPASVYVKGFIKSYAQHVGLDYNELSDLYKKSVPSDNSKDIQFNDFIHIQPAGKMELDSDENKNESKVSMALVVFILILLGSLAISYFSNQKETDNSSSPSASEITNFDVTG